MRATLTALRSPSSAALAAVLLLLSTAAGAHAAEGDASGDANLGRIDFERANLPPANVEVDLSQGTFANLFGIGEAAVAGVAEALTGSGGDGDRAEVNRMAAEQLNAVRQIISLSSKVIREVRVRAYEDLAEDLSSRFDGPLREGQWEKVAVVREDNESARIYVKRDGDAVRGIFVMAGGNDGQILVNVVCDLSPENIKQLTSTATKIGLENGLDQSLQAKFHGIGGGRSSSNEAGRPAERSSAPAGEDKRS
jgi:hypothetical protein